MGIFIHYYTDIKSCRRDISIGVSLYLHKQLKWNKVPKWIGVKAGRLILYRCKFFQVFQFQTGVFEYKEIVEKICAQSGQIEVTSQTDLQVIFVTDDVGNQRTGFVAQFTQTLGRS